MDAIQPWRTNVSRRVYTARNPEVERQLSGGNSAGGRPELADTRQFKVPGGG
jgi:hypothetical protein